MKVWKNINWTRVREDSGCVNHIGSLGGKEVVRVFRLGGFWVVTRADDGAWLAGHPRTLSEAKTAAHKMANTDHPFATLEELDAIRAAQIVLSDDEIEAAQEAAEAEEARRRQGDLF